MPKLADRRDDIPALADYFLKTHCRQFEKEYQPLEPEILSYLQNLSWPGNLRELSNCVARYVLLGPESLMQRETTRVRAATALQKAQSDVVPLKKLAKEAIREMERNAIIDALRANHWNRRKAAQELKISYRSLIYKIRDAGLIVRRTTNQIRPASTERGLTV